jgi:hypothetical protein
MKNLNPTLKRGLLVVVCVILLLLTIWLGYSFFSMKSDAPHLKTEIDLSEDILSKKVPVEEYKNDGRYVSYKYPVQIYEISSDDDGYLISTYANNFLEYFDDIENARFKYFLDKSKGKFDFTRLESDQGIYITNEYRVEKNLKYFIEYSICTVQNVFNKEKYEGKCLIERDMTKWKIEEIK